MAHSDPTPASRPLPSGDPALLRVAYEMQGRRIAAERLKVADELQALLREQDELRARVDLLERELADARARKAAAEQGVAHEAEVRRHAEAELAALEQTKLFRSSAKLRQGYSKLRRKQ
ncbi:MAG: hypothetical protein JWL73_2272 [Actinomycetia bacterium]|nr:hypothetical protein [Actinomycetes bacterium]